MNDVHDVAISDDDVIIWIVLEIVDKVLPELSDTITMSYIVNLYVKYFSSI